MNGSTYGGDKVQCSASPAIADGALFFYPEKQNVLYPEKER
ncbi:MULTISPECIES: hypothetical protein [Klebsiella]|nr:hypothetical protein [Klebsiella michiganensis]